MNTIIKNPSFYLLISVVTACNSLSCGFLARRDECFGIAIKKFRNPDDHLAYTIWVEGKYGEKDLCNIISDDRDSLYLYHNISLGNSIIKKAGEKIYHIKGYHKNYFYERQCSN